MSLESDAQFLSKINIFHDFDFDALKILVFNAHRLDIAAGTVVAKEGDPSSGGLVIFSGQLNLSRKINGQVASIGVRNPGSLLDEMSLIMQIEERATAHATMQTVLLQIPRQIFIRVLEEYPVKARILQEKYTHNLRQFALEIANTRRALIHSL